MDAMKVFEEGTMSYDKWVESLQYYIMGLGIDEKVNTARCLGLFITYGGPKVKETYDLNKDQVKAKDENGNDVSDYQHARNVVDKKLKVGTNQTFETFQYRNIIQRSGETFASFVHRCEVGVSNCGFNPGDKDRHVRDQVVFGTNNAAIREKALSENLELDQLVMRGQGIESSTQFESVNRKFKEEPAFAVFRGHDRYRGQGDTRSGRGTKGSHVSGGGNSSNMEQLTCFKCGGEYPHHGDCPAWDHKCEECHR